MDAPKTDDFRIERQGDQLVVIFTPDGRSYTFRIDGDRLSDPSVSPAQANAADYAEDEICKAATELARLAMKGGSVRRAIPVPTAMNDAQKPQEPPMRTYKVTGMTCGGCEKAVTRAIRKQLGDDTSVEANAGRGEVRVSESADPQTQFRRLRL